MKCLIAVTWVLVIITYCSSNTTDEARDEDVDDSRRGEIERICFDRYDANGIPRRGPETIEGFHKVKCAIECTLRERHMVHENGKVDLNYSKKVYHKSMKTYRDKKFRNMIEFSLNTCYNQSLEYENDGNCTMAYKFNDCIPKYFQVWDGMQYTRECWDKWYRRTNDPDYVEPTFAPIPLDHEPLYRPNTCDEKTTPITCLNLVYWQFCAQGEAMVDSLNYVYTDGEYFLNDESKQNTYFNSLRECYTKSSNLDAAHQYKRNFTLVSCIYTEFDKIY